MKMQRVTSPHLKEPAPGTWSNCRVYGNQVFVAGMTAGDGKGGVEAAGGAMNDTIRVDIYVTDIKQREAVWNARKEFFLLVEVNATGFLGGNAG